MSFEELKTILTSMGVPEEDITPQATREEAGLDSLGVVELVLVLKQKTGLSITEEERHAAETVEDVVTVISGGTAASE
ncbi:MAG: phosphopantetheine-binding protein [Pseudonocardiaceae bacterium]